MSNNINQKILNAYIDFKSPYAYLSIEPTRAFAKDLKLTINWIPYVLEIPDFLGSAKVDDTKKVIESERNEHQWRRVKYSYMDCRRYANLRNITVLGPKKIWNTKLISIACLWVKNKHTNLLNNFIDHVYYKFWKRELDLENITEIKSIFDKNNISTMNFENWSKNEGKKELEVVMIDANNKGVFGVPSYFIDNELFWGREHLPYIKANLTNNYKDIY